ncbi:DUF6101 family protein [Methylobacterium sp. Leaf118]|uniref:DUF6101 family protein n=1 Tax=Methylobacterium sp. Leaf118 TaxID=2876562 RepID=UPI001E2D305F|nr:DUF6101 family protein [Methylobacterium sp. Leaf118]
MMTFEIANQDCPAGRVADAAPAAVSFAATPLPIVAPYAPGTRATGVALAFAEAMVGEGGPDGFALLLLDAEGEVLMRLGPFPEEEVVALWRDVTAKGALVRMLLREDGSLVPVSQQIGRLALGKSRQRRRNGSLSARRPRFLARRKATRLPARPCIHRGESEIIARG